MSRKEFTKQTKRNALDRSCGHCEAVGILYGLKANKRCDFPFGIGVQYDHVNAIRHDDNSLKNCAAVCVKCHAFKTAKIDIPKHAKVKRTNDKHNGIKSKKAPIKSRGFSPHTDNSKQTTVRF